VQFVDLRHPVAVVAVQTALRSTSDHPYFSSYCNSSIIPRYWISRSTNRCFIIPISSYRLTHFSRQKPTSPLRSLHFSW
jgi:hypothetical protein